MCKKLSFDFENRTGAARSHFPTVTSVTFKKPTRRRRTVSASTTTPGTWLLSWWRWRLCIDRRGNHSTRPRQISQKPFRAWASAGLKRPFSGWASPRKSWRYGCSRTAENGSQDSGTTASGKPPMAHAKSLRAPLDSPLPSRRKPASVKDLDVHQQSIVPGWTSFGVGWTKRASVEACQHFLTVSRAVVLVR